MKPRAFTDAQEIAISRPTTSKVGARFVVFGQTQHTQLSILDTGTKAPAVMPNP